MPSRTVLYPPVPFIDQRPGDVRYWLGQSAIATPRGDVVARAMWAVTVGFATLAAVTLTYVARHPYPDMGRALASMIGGTATILAVFAGIAAATRSVWTQWSSSAKLLSFFVVLALTVVLLGVALAVSGAA